MLIPAPGPALRISLSLATVAVALGACATIDVTTTEFAGAPRVGPTDPASVEVLRTEPQRPHDRLGEVMVEATTDPAPKIEDVEKKLRTAGAKMGANAVVVVVDRIAPMAQYVSGPWWDGTIETIQGHKLIGVAIRYK
jgi:hypothetical protein